MKYKKGEKYTTYTYTKNGYKRLFKESGLPTNQFLCAFPTYEQPEAILPCRSDAIHYFHEIHQGDKFNVYSFSMKVFLKRFINKYFIQLIIKPIKRIAYIFWPSFMCPSFIIVSRKKN